MTSGQAKWRMGVDIKTIPVSKTIEHSGHARWSHQSLRYPAYQASYLIARKLIRLHTSHKTNRGDAHPRDECVRDRGCTLATRLVSIEHE